MFKYLALIITLAGFSSSANSSPTAPAEQLALLRQPTPVLDLQPASIWDLPVRDRFVLVAELEQGRLWVFEKFAGTRLEQVATYPITIGKQGFGKTQEGDERTPVGVYRITSQLNEKQLDDFYGDTAYPLNYPNSWDRLNQFTGSGIWLHGVEDDSVQRPLRDSDGCIVLSNADLQELGQYLNIGYTKVLGVPQIKWVTNEEISNSRHKLTSRMRLWARAWESKDPEKYLSFYSKQFSDTEKNYQQWASYKRRVNTNKRFIKIRLSDLGIYAYPGQDQLAMTEFYQNYSSNRFHSKGWKRQLWKREADGEWRIIYEKGG